MSTLSPETETMIAERPRTVSAILDLYEGFAQHCEQIASDPTMSARLERQTAMYRKLLGFDFYDRNAVRERLKQLN